MNEIYVTGHRNPDTDSIVAAMSYAALKNALGEKEYVAVHLGTISDETNRMLERFISSRPAASRMSALRCRIWTSTVRPAWTPPSPWTAPGS